MKLARLMLQAFGPFTDTVLDFASGTANLHLIYGPNEAGKSSALRAITDLRFGIPMHSPDDFIHTYADMRVAGVFFAPDGNPIGLARRKGREPTLLQFDLATGHPDAEHPVLREQEAALTGGLDRADFEAMFGLNHLRLRAGGVTLLRGEGELGSALFEASAGTRGIAALLAGLDDDAKALFNPRGQAKKAVINEARRQLDEHRQILRQAQTRPSDWQGLHRDHETAKTALDDIDRELEKLRRGENELTELRTVEPLLGEHDRLDAELAMLADVPDLSVSAREDRLAAESALGRAKQDLEDAEDELARCHKGLLALSIEPAVLEHAGAIERLAAAVEGAARSRVEAKREQVEIERIQAALTDTATRIAPGKDAQTLLAGVPSAADRVALDAHLDAIGQLTERLEGQRQRADSLEQALGTEETEPSAAPDPAARMALADALRRAQGLGDVDKQIADLDRQVRPLGTQLQQSVADLGSASAQALRAAQPLLEAEIARVRDALSEIGAVIQRLEDEDERLQRDLKEQQLRRRELAAEGEVVTSETLRLSREQRDHAWSLVRRAYVERSADADVLGASFDPTRPLPRAFEAAQSEADRQADLLRADATRAASVEECSGRVADMESRRDEIAGELHMRGQRKEMMSNEWAQRLTAVRLPTLQPDGLREWQNARQRALEFDDRLTELLRSRVDIAQATTSACAALSGALVAAGEPIVSVQVESADVLLALIEKASNWEKRAAEMEAARNERDKTLRGYRTELKTLDRSISLTTSELGDHHNALRGWSARLFLATDSTPNVLKARLGELDALGRLAMELADARLRRAHHQAVLDDVAEQASVLAQLLGEPKSFADDDFSDRLRERLRDSREQDQQRVALTRDEDKAREKKHTAEDERLLQTEHLAGLCAAAGVDSIDRLPEREDSATRKGSIRTQLGSLRQSLIKASNRSEAELREKLTNLDAAAIEAEQERCRADITRLKGEQVDARDKEEAARRALEAIDTSDQAATAREAMESAAARYRAAIRPWARLRFAHALLSDALNRFRERAQAPMVGAASTYFSLMTGGRYERLVADEEGDRPVLRALRADGKQIGVEAMSDGTADQLYLALRVAALELRRASHPQMPLILDDVLITSDDARAANILRGLAKFSEGGQVMLFTHHRHLIDVAQAALKAHELAVHTL